MKIPEPGMAYFLMSRGGQTEHQNNTGDSHCFWLPTRTERRDYEDAIQFCCRRNPAATDLKFPPCWLAFKGLGGALQATGGWESHQWYHLEANPQCCDADLPSTSGTRVVVYIL